VPPEKCSQTHYQAKPYAWEIQSGCGQVTRSLALHCNKVNLSTGANGGFTTRSVKPRDDLLRAAIFDAAGDSGRQKTTAVLPVFSLQ